MEIPPSGAGPKACPRRCRDGEHGDDKSSEGEAGQGRRRLDRISSFSGTFSILIRVLQGLEARRRCKVSVRIAELSQPAGVESTVCGNLGFSDTSGRRPR